MQDRTWCCSNVDLFQGLYCISILWIRKQQHRLDCVLFDDSLSQKKTLATEYKNTSNYNTRAHLQSVQDRTRGCSNINLFRGLRQISILRFTNNRWWKNITVKKIIAYSLSLISWATSKEKKIHATRSSMIISKAHLESAGVRIFTLSLSRLCFDESSFSGGWRRALWRWAAKGPSASSGSRIDQFTD